jgi:hypothetical protein
VTPTAALSFQSIGAGFNILGVPIARDAALVEAGGDLQLTAQAKVGVSYAGQLANSAHDHSVKGNFPGVFDSLPPKADLPILELLPPSALGERSHCSLARRPGAKSAKGYLRSFPRQLGLSERPSVLMPIPSAFLAVFTPVLSPRPDGCENA